MPISLQSLPDPSTLPATQYSLALGKASWKYDKYRYWVKWWGVHSGKLTRWWVFKTCLKDSRQRLGDCLKITGSIILATPSKVVCHLVCRYQVGIYISAFNSSYIHTAPQSRVANLIKALCVLSIKRGKNYGMHSLEEQFKKRKHFFSLYRSRRAAPKKFTNIPEYWQSAWTFKAMFSVRFLQYR